MRKYIGSIASALALCVVLSFLGWAIHFHTTVGMLRVDNRVLILFIVLAVLGLFPLFLWLLRKWLKNKKRRTAFLSVVITVIIVIDIAIPAAGFVYTSGAIAAGISPNPELLMGYGSGSQGIPNIMLVSYTEKPEKQTLRWGTSDLSDHISDTSVSLQHTFLLKDLAPGTTYRYKIDNGLVYSFRTPSNRDDSLHIAVGSDAHFGAGNNRTDLTEKMLRQIADKQNNFDYEKYCRPAINDLTNGDNLRYRVDIGKIHILVLDLEWSAESYPGPQTAWLEQQLANIPAGDWKIVMSHGFYYGSGYIQNSWKWYDNPETIDLYTPIFEKYGVNMVFSGHNHDLELLQHSGVTYVIAGAFGGLLDDEKVYTSPASLWYASGRYAYVDLMISSDISTIKFRDPDGNILKEIEVAKQ